jgi:hypothetical protein
MFMTGSSRADAERAFDHATRARRRASLTRRLRRQCTECGALPVYDERQLRRAGADLARGIREIPLNAISGTVEPSRAAQFDRGFRPAALVRTRWQRVWLAEQMGALLPPISLVPVADGYALRDGHHRVSVAKARGAVTIDAVIESS